MDEKVMTDLEEIFTNLRKQLEVDNNIREELITLGRQSIQKSSMAIRHLHRREFTKTEVLIKENEELIARLNEISGQMRFVPTGLIISYNQEFAEAVLLSRFLQDAPLPSYVDLKVPYISYLHGVADFLGELRRVVLDLLRKENNTEGLKSAVHTLHVMEDLHTLLTTLDFPDGLTHNLRRKTDRTRNLIERTRGDITLAINRRDLVDTFREILHMYFPERDPPHT
jgi:translin